MARSTDTPPSEIPAFAITLSIGPNAACASSNPASTEASEVTSIATATASPPASRISCVRAVRRSVRRAARATFAPAVAQIRAKRRPRPDEAPVTSTLRPASCRVSDNEQPFDPVRRFQPYLRDVRPASRRLAVPRPRAAKLPGVSTHSRRYSFSDARPRYMLTASTIADVVTGISLLGSSDK